MKKSEFEKLKVGDEVFLKDTTKIKQMKQWDGEYFEDGEGSRWGRFMVNRDILNGRSIRVVRRNSFYTDVVTVRCADSYFEIPRKCLRNKKQETRKEEVE